MDQTQKKNKLRFLDNVLGSRVARPHGPEVNVNDDSDQKSQYYLSLLLTMWCVSGLLRCNLGRTTVVRVPVQVLWTHGMTRQSKQQASRYQKG